MLPARNRRDFEEIPEDARQKLEFVWLERVDDAVRHALAEGGSPASTSQNPQAEPRPLAALPAVAGRVGA